MKTKNSQLTRIRQSVAMLYPRNDAPEPILACVPERIQAVWGPMDKILDAIEATGELETAAGKPVLNEGGDWYELVPAIRGLVVFHEIASARTGKPVDTGALSRFANKLEVLMPLCQGDVDAARACIEQCKAQAAQLRVSEAADITRVAQVKLAMEGVQAA